MLATNTGIRLLVFAPIQIAVFSEPSTIGGSEKTERSKLGLRQPYVM